MFCVKFSDWITKKYIEWRGEAIGHNRTITEFAQWIGVTQSLMTQWMSRGGKTPKSHKTVEKLAFRFGAEVYEVLGLTPPEPTIDMSEEEFTRFVQGWAERHGRVVIVQRVRGSNTSDPDKE